MNDADADRTPGSADDTLEPPLAARQTVKDQLDALYRRGPWDTSALGEEELAILRKFGIAS